MGKHSHFISEVDEEQRTGICAVCGPVKLKRKKQGSGYRWGCGVLEGKWRPAAASHMLTPDEHRERLGEQDHRCAICKQIRPLVVDHSHTTGAVRGLLCVPCNCALAAFEQEGWAENARKYLGQSPNFV